MPTRATPANKKTDPPPKPQPAPAPRPATAPVAGPATRVPAAPPTVLLKAPAAGEVAPGVLDLKGMPEFKPPAAISEFLDARKNSTINARFGDLAQGFLQVRTIGKGKYRIKKQPLTLTHPAFGLVAEFAPGLMPALIVGVSDTKIIGEVGLAAGEKIESIAHRIQKAPEMIGLAGFKITAMPAMTNTIEGGNLHLGLQAVEIKLGSAFKGKFNFDVRDSAVAFDASAKVAVKGLNGDLILKRAASGLVTGQVAIALTVGKGLSGNVDVAWNGVGVTGIGKLAYKGEKFSGEVTMFLMEKKQAEQLAKAKQPPSAAPALAPPKQAPAHIDYVVFGEGNLGFSFTPWLNGTAQAIFDPKGNLTVIGELKPQKEFSLFKDPPQKDYVKELFKFEIHATYGLPPIADVFIFASVGMDLFAKLGPARIYDIVILGTYSTDPTVAKNFSIGASLNFSAAAGVRLRIEAGAGLEILGHDIKAGAGITGIAGIKAYAQADPVVGYREKAVEGQDLKGEWFISGSLEMGAQPFLGLGGDLFVELETPWWSPLSDDKWTWPLFNKEWPLGGAIGMVIAVEHVFGSGEFPKFDLKPLKEFKAENCVTELYKDNAKSGPGKAVEQKGQWAEKNTRAANPPPKTPQPGNLKPGKPAALPKAKPKQVAKKKGQPATPDAKTKGGKSVKQLEAEAQKKGKGPKGKDAAKEPKGKEVGKAAKDDKTKGDTRTLSEKERDLRGAVTKAEEIANASNHSRRAVNKQLPAIKREFRLTAITLIAEKDGRISVRVEINPFFKKTLDVTDEPELRALLIETKFFGSSPTEIDRIIKAVKSDGNGDAVFQFIKSRKFKEVPGYEQLMRNLKQSTMVHSVYMALDQADRLGPVWIPRMRFEQEPPGGGDLDLAVVGMSGAWSAVYQFKGVNGIGNIATQANKSAYQLRNVSAKTLKIVSIEVQTGTHAEFLASANPALGHEGYMGGIKAFKAANPTIRLKVTFSDRVTVTF